MLREGLLAKKMKSFIKNANSMSQTDSEKAIDNFCTEFENDIYNAIRSITITIPAGTINVVGSPSAQANVTPIVLTAVIQ